MNRHDIRIEWVNHASFILAVDEVRLITDPWLEGTAFDRGWGLLSHTQFRYEDFADITHIWFSHEHPDHFSPPNLKKIPESCRRQIAVLFQETPDRKVVNFCRELGFKAVTELRKDQWFQLSERLSVLCVPFTGGDSWICFKTPDMTLLNLNDCVITHARHVQDIQAKVGKVDVLLTQFCYANWVGNENDLKAMRANAEEKLARVKLQIDVLHPEWVIPFASFVWFCHEDNYYMNQGVNRIRDVCSYIESQTAAKPAAFYPGETWQVGAPVDLEATLAKYDADYRTVFESPSLIRSKLVREEDLIAHSLDFARAILADNNRLLLRAFSPAKIYIVDYQASFSFSLKEGLKRASYAYEACDIAVKSDALDYAFRFAWGGGTLAINGRFQVPNNNYWGFMKYGQVRDINNNGERFDWGYLLGLFVRKVFRKVS